MSKPVRIRFTAFDLMSGGYTIAAAAAKHGVTLHAVVKELRRMHVDPGKSRRDRLIQRGAAVDKALEYRDDMIAGAAPHCSAEDILEMYGCLKRDRCRYLRHARAGRVNQVQSGTCRTKAGTNQKSLQNLFDEETIPGEHRFLSRGRGLRQTKRHRAICPNGIRAGCLDEGLNAPTTRTKARASKA